MNEEKKKLKITANKKIITFSMIALALLMLVSTSYAYFTAVITGNDTAKRATVKTGTMSLRLHGNTQVGMSSAMPGESTTITFSVENTGTLDTTYVLKMDQVTNDFKDKKDLVYVLKKGNTIIKEETPLPSPISGTTVLLPVVKIAAGTTDSYTMIITFKETGDDQNDNQGKTFTGRVQIGEATDKMLAVNLINNSNLKTTTPDFSTYPDESNTGLFTAEDEEGTSYYFRGNIENNYVDIGTTHSEDIEIYIWGINGTSGIVSAESSYYDAVDVACEHSHYEYNGYETIEACVADIQDQSIHIGDKMLWRVVRINGDGTIRLISDNIVSKQAFNTTHNDHKYVGYTYDDSWPSAGDGTASSIKSYLDSWYITNITNTGLDNLIQISTYCNDTSISESVTGGTTYYGADSRIDNGASNTPQLTCNVTPQTYGGKYALKVGLLSADELMMGGYSNIDSTYASQKTYIWNPNSFWTGTPSNSTTSNSRIFRGNQEGSIDYTSVSNSYNGVRPVINLRSDILISSGNGTKENPYVIR